MSIIRPLYSSQISKWIKYWLSCCSYVLIWSEILPQGLDINFFFLWFFSAASPVSCVNQEQIRTSREIASAYYLCIMRSSLYLLLISYDSDIAIILERFHKEQLKTLSITLYSVQSKVLSLRSKNDFFHEFHSHTVNQDKICWESDSGKSHQNRE